MKIFEFLKWKNIDIYRAFKNRHEEKIHLYGIFGFFGLPGFGKTMAMSEELLRLREKYGDRIYIFTNYGFKFEDAPFTHWKMLLEEYDKPCVFAWDEVQNEFNSRDYSNFPVELLTLLTQNRKGHGKRIYYTAQKYNRVDKVFRELSFLVGECKTLMGRYTRVRWFDTEDYEMLLSTPDVNKRIKIKPRKKYSFIQSDFIRDSYDSYKMLETAKNRDYINKRDIKIEEVQRIL
ncbi:hypothetical protein [Clostridium sp.]|uniref:hypothetical protein n=1 Tax=Clostridium sp. TaxID=1506 RepID=UPI0026DA6F2B|nr:hypothetical protein [Clostridium sp.]MDO5040234.1 hypothetical protein [Clostridium sp.]